MQLSQQGVIAHQYWLQIPEHFSFVSLDAFVVMPNHIHGILIIDKPVPVETLHATSLQEPNNTMSTISPKPNSIPAIIRSFKSAVTKYCKENKLPFGWQTRFHDHIIRDNKEWERIQTYIINNRANWENDDLFK